MSDLLDDLKADLAPAPPAAAAPVPLPSVPPRRTTPALELTVTPLRWSLPGLALDRGLRLRVGPVQVGLTRR